MADVRRGSSLWIRVGLGVYACVCLVLFIWMRFPYDSVKLRIEDALTRVLGAPVVLGHIEPTLLAGFRINGIEIKGSRIAGEVTVNPRPWEVFRGGLGFTYHAVLAAGTADGRMRLPFRKSKRPMELTIDMENVDLSGMSTILPPAMKLQGVVSGEISLTTPRESFDKATGGLTLSWKKGSLPLGMPSLPFDALTFDTLDLEGSIDKGLLDLEKAEFTGDYSGSMTGSIRLSRDVKRSRLNITGEVTLPEAMRKALGSDSMPPGQGSRFTLRGSLEKPRFRLLGSNADRAARRPAAIPGRSVLVPAQNGRVTHEVTRREAAPPIQEAAQSYQGEDPDLEPQDVEPQLPSEPEGE